MEELQNRAKQYKTVSYIILALAIIYAVFTFYQMFSGTFEMKTPQIALPVFIIFLGIAVSRNQKGVKEEIQNRQNASWR